jgi:hypothetical protein
MKKTFSKEPWTKFDSPEQPAILKWNSPLKSWTFTGPGSCNQERLQRAPNRYQ